MPGLEGTDILFMERRFACRESLTRGGHTPFNAIGLRNVPILEFLPGACAVYRGKYPLLSKVPRGELAVFESVSGLEGMSQPTAFDLSSEDAIRNLADRSVLYAASGLAELAGPTAALCVEQVFAASYVELASLIGEPDQLFVATSMRLHGDLGGHLALTFAWPAAQRLWRTLSGDAPDDLDEMTEAQGSTLLDLGSILGAGLAEALIGAVGAPLSWEPPMMAIDLPPTLVSTLAVPTTQRDTLTLALRIELDLGEEPIPGRLLYLPTKSSMRTLFHRLGYADAA